MTHVLVSFDADTQTVELATDVRGHIALTAGLETATLYSIGSNKYSKKGGDEPFGWWADDYPEVQGDEFGSDIWLYHGRGKITPEGTRLAFLAGEESLGWLVTDGLASSLSFTFATQGSIGGLSVRINRPDGDQYNAVWKVHEDAV